jgi:hypothetical protein
VVLPNTRNGSNYGTSAGVLLLHSAGMSRAEQVPVINCTGSVFVLANWPVVIGGSSFNR